MKLIVEQPAFNDEEIRVGDAIRLEYKYNDLRRSPNGQAVINGLIMSCGKFELKIGFINENRLGTIYLQMNEVKNDIVKVSRVKEWEEFE